MKKQIRKLLKKPYYLGLHTGKKIRNASKSTARIILYHRIADVKNDPHLLAVSPENFRQQITYLKENFKIIPLVKLIRDIRAGAVQDNSIAITFDDGYLDNLTNAVPILKEFNVPATIYIIAGQTVNPTRPSWFDSVPEEDQGQFMNREELRRLSEVHLIEIGAHTITHPILSKLDIEDQKNEIGPDKELIENLTSLPVLSFAYPYGSKDSFTSQTIELVKKAGFHYACANIHERVTNNTDIYALPRFIARNWDSQELKKQMANWL